MASPGSHCEPGRTLRGRGVTRLFHGDLASVLCALLALVPLGKAVPVAALTVTRAQVAFYARFFAPGLEALEFLCSAFVISAVRSLRKEQRAILTRRTQTVN